MYPLNNLPPVGRRDVNIACRTFNWWWIAIVELIDLLHDVPLNRHYNEGGWDDGLRTNGLR